jgi:histidine triad (HIT) family protein
MSGPASETGDCIFCKIESGEIPGDFLHRDEVCFVIRDIAPTASTHLLVIPNEHFTHLDGLDPKRADMVGHMVMVARQMAQAEGIADSGYRLVINQKDDAGQLIDHLHLHVLGGEKLGRMG